MNSTASLNPFVLMLDPEAVITAMESSRDLRGLRHRVCRPLDKPLIPITHRTLTQRSAMRAYDAAIDNEAFMDSGVEFYATAQPALQHAVH